MPPITCTECGFAVAVDANPLRVTCSTRCRHRRSSRRAREKAAAQEAALAAVLNDPRAPTHLADTARRALATNSRPRRLHAPEPAEAKDAR